MKRDWIEQIHSLIRRLELTALSRSGFTLSLEDYRKGILIFGSNISILIRRVGKYTSRRGTTLTMRTSFEPSRLPPSTSKPPPSPLVLQHPPSSTSLLSLALTLATLSGSPPRPVRLFRPAQRHSSQSPSSREKHIAFSVGICSRVDYVSLLPACRQGLVAEEIVNGRGVR